MEKKEAVKILTKELQWSPLDVEIGIRANFRCEYCGRYLLDDIYTYDSWQKDHIIPNGDNDLKNMALSCKLCNFMKRGADPSLTCKSQDRDLLIAEAKNILSKRRAEKQRILDLTKEAVSVLSE